MAEGARRGVRAKQRDATRARLLRVARRVFAELGYDAASVGVLCKRAKVTHGALYHHFPSGKHELFAAVVADVFAALGARVRAAVAEHEGWDGVRAACDAYLDACADAEVQAIVFRDGPRVLSSQHASIDHEANEPLVTSLLRGWMAEGLLRPRPVVTLARLLGALFEEAGALVGAAADRAHTRTQVSALLQGWIEALRRAPGERQDVLATDRLVLEPVGAADASTLAALLAELGPSAQARLAEGEVTGGRWAARVVVESQRRFARGELGVFAARDGEQRLVGVAGFGQVGRRGPEELGVVVDPSVTRRGYGYEIADAVLGEAWARGSANARASVHERDVASGRLFAKLGFVRWAKRVDVVELVCARPARPAPSR